MQLWLLILLFVGPIVLLAAFVGSVAWVWRDADRRGQPGFIVAVLVAFLFWPLSLIAWLLARPAVQTAAMAAAPPPSRSGRGCLWAALIALIVLGLLMVISFWWLLNAAPAAPMRGLSGAREAARGIACQNNVKELALMHITYTKDHGGTPPRSLEDLRQYGLEDKLLHCPAAGKDGPPSYRLDPGSNETDIIILENWKNHGGKGGTIAFGDGHVEWVNSPCKPLRLDVVKAAVERQLRVWFDDVEKKFQKVLPEGLGDKSVQVGAVTFNARANCYQVEVHWQVQGREFRSVMRLDPAGFPGLSRYTGTFGLCLDNVPDSVANPVIPVVVDELMDGPAVEKERP
jgi:prepilin-type processing-associated H-X9-DG protein